MKKFKVISIHAWTGGCNLNCPFCYQKHEHNKNTKPHKFWYELIQYIKKLTPQVALGADGEPFMDVAFIKEFSKKCKQNELICNVTTNGKLLMKMPDKELKEALKDITMVSISYDSYKIRTLAHRLDYVLLTKRIKRLTNCQVGCNLLINKNMDLIQTVRNRFNEGIDRVFALYPKNMPKVDIIKKAFAYFYLNNKYKHFYIDDCSRCILKSKSYDNWKMNCHRGKEMISINSEGGVSSCSFAEPFAYLKQPEDILKLKVPKEELGKNYCPFIK